MTFKFKVGDRVKVQETHPEYPGLVDTITRCTTAGPSTENYYNLDSTGNFFFKENLLLEPEVERVIEIGEFNKRCPECASSGELLDFTKPQKDIAPSFRTVTVTGFCDNCGATIILEYHLKRIRTVPNG